MELKKRRNAYLMFLLLCLIAAAAIAGMSALLYQSGTNRQSVADENAGEEADGENDGIAAGETAGAENGGEIADGENDGKAAGGTEDTENGVGTEAAADGAQTGGVNENGAAAANAAGENTENASADTENTADGSGGDAEDGEDLLAAAGQTSDAVLAAKIAAYSFEAGKIIWPVEGEICLEYNMEHTVYFSTLDLYRCNPGVCIRAEAGTAVLAGVDGVVTAVTEDSFYGTMVTVAVGDDYEVTYGQLADAGVSVGDEVSAATQIASVAEPTIYFTEEGSHLFLEITKDGETVDPLDYLNY